MADSSQTTLHLGLDLGGTNIKIAVLAKGDEGYSVRSTRSVETDAGAGPDTVVDNLVSVGRDAISGEEMATIGLGVPGRFDRQTGQIILFPNLPGGWNGYPLRDRVGSGVGMEVWMVNDARAFTLAEGLLGAGKGHGTVACITLGTGVGGGVIIEGKLHLGAFGVAGELGHQTVVPDGPLCGCGNRGCVEALVRADVLCANAGRATASEVFEGARNGDERCLAAASEMAGYLGIGLANVVAILGPDRIVVGGGIAEAGDLVLEPIRRAVRERVTLVPTERVEIVPAALGPYAGAIGAALAGAIRP